MSAPIPDDMGGIFDRLKEAALTMKMGGGIGYDFSTLRPSGSNIRTLDSDASGPLSFMAVYDSACGTVSSSGHRRGAQMAVLRVDHPDIEEYIRAKNNSNRLTNFNTSIAVTDEFMQAVKNNQPFDLRFEGRVYKTINAAALWEEIMRSTWDWAEPGVLFIDRINEMNNLYYCEEIAATNPCGEQPLPPYGACLLGSVNLTKHLKFDGYEVYFDYAELANTVRLAVRMLDAVIDIATYPLPEQEAEAKNKRRMGIGVTGLANVGELLNMPYGSEGFLNWTEGVLETIRDTAYEESIELAKEKGPFPLFSRMGFCSSKFIETLPNHIQESIYEHGIRNSHLLSIAPTGTISMAADNVSSGLEPPFSLSYKATIKYPEGETEVTLKDWAYEEYGLKGRTSDELTALEHVQVLCAASKYVDSACSKTCNVGPEVSFGEFKEIYMYAYDNGAKGCTTYRSSGKRNGVRNKEEEYVDGAACYINPETGQKECS